MREKIAESAINQILKFGLRKFTIDDITAELGISKKTVYKYFNSKNQLIEYALDNYLAAELNKQNQVMTLNKSFRKRFEALTSPANHKQIPTRLLAELQQFFPELWDKCEEVIQITRNQIIQIYADGIKNGEIRSEVHPAVIDLVVKNAIAGVLDYRFLAENDIGLIQALEGVKSMVLYGILVQDNDSGGRE
ncbi:MAG: TetR/AcrR family transcriptional regulator [Syntrophomonadaceae bacterium]